MVCNKIHITSYALNTQNTCFYFVILTSNRLFAYVLWGLKSQHQKQLIKGSTTLKINFLAPNTPT